MADSAPAPAQPDERFRDYPETDILAYEIELTIDPAMATVQGKVHIRILAQEDLGAVRLDAQPRSDWQLAFHQEQELAFTRETDERVRVALAQSETRRRGVVRFVYAPDVENAKKSLVHHAAWLKLMETVFGPYPYASYCIAQVPTRWGGWRTRATPG